MPYVLPDDEMIRILRYWWMTELFSPQKLPPLTSAATRTAERQVIVVRGDDPLPWEVLKPPPPIDKTQRVWRHTVYLGTYDLDATYEHLHRSFGEDHDAYDERPTGQSACAGIMVDNHGRLVPGSAVLSSALWAVAQINNGSSLEHTWENRFTDAAQTFIEMVDKAEGAHHESSDTCPSPPQDMESLRTLLHIAQKVAGITGTPGLSTGTIVIQSVSVSAQRADEVNDTDFLNSFFLEDLEGVRTDILSKRRCGDALAAYLTKDSALNLQARVDVIQRHEAMDADVAPSRLPKGHWPSDPKFPLALRQQFAVNQALNNLALTGGLMGVNGPPGTGKTTMLRDILAGNVVKRAQALAALSSPGEAFTSTTYRWKGKEGHSRSVRQLRRELTGFEMIIASANNGAVENVTAEIPVRKEISSQWRASADYFAEIATAVLTESQPSSDTSDTPAWGMIAARLGNKRNRSSFHSAFWFDKKDSRKKEPAPDSVPRMQTRLAQWRDGLEPYRSWPEACARFTQAEQRVDTLLAQHRQAHERLQRISQESEKERYWHSEVARSSTEVREIGTRLVTIQNIAEHAHQEATHALTTRDRHITVKPGALETILTFGRALQEWRATLIPLDEQVRTTEAAQHQAKNRTDQIQTQLDILQNQLSAAEKSRKQISENISRLQLQIADDKKAIGASHPSTLETREARELRAPWLTEELDTARSELFLAALQLHQDFLANTAADMSHGLRAALEVVSGGGPHNLEPEKRLAAWQLFFLVVPIVSTTFASLSRMLGNIGPEGIGWLLIDEAGQASPQYAVGAISRARCVVAVGDPLQLQPVVTIPQKAQRDIASAYGVSSTWTPPQSSVQTLTDRVARYGTALQQEEQQVWVSAPLTVHRRCDDPMFTLCNDIAYNGIMVNGVTHRPSSPQKPDIFDNAAGTLIAASRWVDEPATTRGTHLQENQIVRVERALAYLNKRGVPMKDIIAISPFRAVAERLESLSHSYPGLQAGTIHAAQGRQASVVLLVLGGDPGSPGAKAWAASSVNLVNVAVSRAKRRIYVIGDRNAWVQHNYFRQLAASLLPADDGHRALRVVDPAGLEPTTDAV